MTTSVVYERYLKLKRLWLVDHSELDFNSDEFSKLWEAAKADHD